MCHGQRVLPAPIQGDRRRIPAPQRDPAARAFAHVVRRPGDDAVVGRHLAEGVVRDLHGARWRRPRSPGGPTRGPPSPTPTRPGHCARISCRRRTRSSPTSRRSTTSPPTSTASPTPRAPRCSSSWSPTSARTSSSPASGNTSTSTHGATPRWSTCWTRWRRRPAGTCPAGPTTGCRPPGRTRCGPTIHGSTLTIHQETVPLRPHRIAVGLYSLRRRPPGAYAPIRTRRRRRHDRRRRSPASARADLVLLNDDDLTYAKIRFDDCPLATLREVGIGAFAESLPRALCWLAVWDMTRTAELAGARLHRAGAPVAARRDRHRPADRRASEPGDRARPLRRTGTPATQAREQVTAFARHHLMWATPGGDAQLAWARLLIRLAGSDDDLDFACRAARRLDRRSTGWPSTTTCAGGW